MGDVQEKWFPESLSAVRRGDSLVQILNHNVKVIRIGATYDTGCR